MSNKPTPIVDPKQNEVRTLDINQIEIRKDGSSGNQIFGRAAVYNEFVQLKDWWGDIFYERIDSKALDDTLADNHEILALRHHNVDAILGRTGVNLKLDSREDGLHFELQPNNSTAGKDILEDVRSGLIKGCSIGFRIIEQEWEERDGEWFRTIYKLDLIEISLTPIPAYTATSAEVRSLASGSAKPEPGTDTPENLSKDAEKAERQAFLAYADRVITMLGGEN